MQRRRAAQLLVLLAGAAVAFAAGLWMLGESEDLLATALGVWGVAALATLQRLIRLVEGGGS